MKNLTVYLLVGFLLSAPSLASAACPALPKLAEHSIFFEMKAKSGSSTNGVTAVNLRRSESTAEGTLAYSPTLKTLILCDGKSWIPLDREP
jgi:hypothetical protein